ncbi:MAG: hypothetical protein ACREA9_04135 [Pyrinomonadaceae bacterium]
MTNKIRKQILPLLGIACFALLGFMMNRTAKSQQINTPDPQEEVKAVRRGGLREAARAKGHYASTVRTSGWGKYDIDSLTKNSVAVIVGVPLTSTSQLSNNNELITTQYQVKTREVLKGDVIEGQLVKVNVLGGRVTFEDGTSAEIKAIDMEPMEQGNAYILFLKDEKDNPGVFGLTGGGQGLFGLSNNDSLIQPQGDRTDVVQKHKNQRIEDFVEQIKIAVSKYPRVSSCCNN